MLYVMTHVNVIRVPENNRQLILPLVQKQFNNVPTWLFLNFLKFSF